MICLNVQLYNFATQSLGLDGNRFPYLFAYLTLQYLIPVFRNPNYMIPDRSALIDTPTDINTRKYGRLIHLYDELSERLLFNSGSIIRNKLKKSSAGDENKTLTWDELRSLDVDIYSKIREKAWEYGYDS